MPCGVFLIRKVGIKHRWTLCTYIFTNTPKTHFTVCVCDRVVADWTISNPEPDLDREKLICGSQNNTPDETPGVNNAVSCYKQAVQFTASFVTSLFLTKCVQRQWILYFYCWSNTS